MLTGSNCQVDVKEADVNYVNYIINIPDLLENIQDTYMKYDFYIKKVIFCLCMFSL